MNARYPDHSAPIQPTRNIYHAILLACGSLTRGEEASCLFRYIAWTHETPKGAALGRWRAMKTFVSACVLTVITALPAWSATVTNKDGEATVLVVVEGESRMEVAISAGSTESICPSGCFITTPSGDRIGLQGDETIEIVNGSAVVK